MHRGGAFKKKIDVAPLSLRLAVDKTDCVIDIIGHHY
jgi:hypothetical protein